MMAKKIIKSSNLINIAFVLSLLCFEGQQRQDRENPGHRLSCHKKTALRTMFRGQLIPRYHLCSLQPHDHSLTEFPMKLAHCYGWTRSVLISSEARRMRAVHPCSEDCSRNVFGQRRPAPLTKRLLSVGLLKTYWFPVLAFVDYYVMDFFPCQENNWKF